MMGKPFAQMTARELVAAVKRLLERNDLSDRAAAAAALVAILTWEDRNEGRSDTNVTQEAPNRP